MISPVYASGGVDIFNPSLNPTGFESFAHLVATLLPNLYILAGVVFFLLLIAGGFGIIFNAGKGQKEGMAKNNKLITISVIGFLVIISSYWIIQIISVVTGLNILDSGL